MKRVVAGFLLVGLMALLVVAPTPAYAGGRFWGGFAVGAFTGLVFANAFAPRVYYAPPPVVYQPAPVYVTPAPVYAAPVPVYAASMCTDYWVEGYWYYRTWVPGRWVRVCR